MQLPTSHAIPIPPHGQPPASATLLLPSGLAAIALRPGPLAATWFLLHDATLTTDDNDEPVPLLTRDLPALLHASRFGRRRWLFQLQPAVVFNAPHDPHARMLAPARVTLSRRLVTRPTRHTATLLLHFQAVPPASPQHPIVLLQRLRRAARIRSNRA